MNCKLRIIVILIGVLKLFYVLCTIFDDFKVLDSRWLHEALE